MGKKVKLRWWALILALLFLVGCAKAKDSTEKVRDLEFTVLAEDNIPKELLTVIEGKKQDAFKITYQDNGFLYICVGYGQQVSGGYSITVNALYLTENAVYADTTLLGPDPAQGTSPGQSMPSYPYVVIKTEFIDKPVVFD